MLLKSIQKILQASLFFFSVSAAAQTNGPVEAVDTGGSMSLILAIVLAISILVLLIAVYLLYVVRQLLLKEQIQKAASLPSGKTIRWSRISAKLTRATPVEEEESIMLEHDYDGIRELDNHLPPWWKGLFYFTIVFGVLYLVVYHMIQPSWAPLQDEAYALEISRFEEQRSHMANFIDENNVAISTEAAALENGKQIFAKNCSPCHRNDGGGSIGPNLTDNYWIHGNEIRNVFATVKNGVPGKMVAWGPTLSGTDIRDVSSFVLTSLVGTTPDAPKAPEGELIDDSGKMKTDSLESTDGKPVASVIH